MEKTVSDTLAHFYHACNLAIVTIQVVNIDQRVENLSVTVTLYALPISVTATNAASFVEQFRSTMP